MYSTLIDFWYNGHLNIFRPEWFSHDLDVPIREKFGELHTTAENGELQDWKTTKYGKLAYIILLDQFTRNLYRNEDFRRNDKVVLELVEEMLLDRQDLHYSNMTERMFILLPLRHSKSSVNIRRVLAFLEEYTFKCDVLEKFKLATIKDLTKCNDDFIYSLLDKEEFKIDISKYIDILDLEYPKREKLNNSINLTNIVKKYVDKYSIKRTGVSLSGGIDSMVVIDILSDILGSENVIAVHICHSNRQESLLELQFLIDLCKSKRIVLVYRKVDYMNRETVDRNFYEDETKQIRFGLYRKVIEQYGLDGMCLGHHRDDIGENVMMNIINSRDVIDLKGMSERKLMDNVMISRPLLGVKKEVVWGYGSIKDIPCFNDSTPGTSWRGVLRKQIYPKMDERIGSIHTILAALGDKSEEWNIILEKMVFTPIFNKIEYYKNGCIIPLDLSAIDLPTSFFSKLFVHVFHNMSTRMTSVKNLQEFLRWIADKKDNYFSFSNGYIAKNEIREKEIILYIVQSNVLERSSWKYTIKKTDILYNVPCTWKDILTGSYRYSQKYTEHNKIEEVRVFNKSDTNRKLVKGFDFLPKISSGVYKADKDKYALVEIYN